MSSVGEGVALGPPGPRSRSRLLHFPVIGPVWDGQGPRDQESEVGTEAELKVQGEQAWGEGSEMEFKVLGGQALNPGIGDGDPSPQSPHLSLLVGPAMASSSCWAILRMWEAR